MVATRVLFLGGWGHHYLRELLVRPAVDIEAAACGDGIDDMARLIADHSDGVAWFSDPEVALAEFSPDVVSVGAVYASNGRWAARCLEVGAAVVCDKPVAVDHSQLDRLRELTAGTRSPRLVTELPARSDSSFRTAHEVVSAGTIGEPVLAVAQKSYPFGERPSWYDDPQHYPGTLLWVATHAFDFTHFVTGRRLAPRSGRTGNLALSSMPSVDDHTVTLCELEGGGTAVVHADYLRPPGATSHGDDRLRVAGTAGVVEVRGGRCWLLVDGETVDITDDGLGESPADSLWRMVHHDDEASDRSLGLAETMLEARRVSGPR